MYLQVKPFSNFSKGYGSKGVTNKVAANIRYISRCFSKGHLDDKDKMDLCKLFDSDKNPLNGDPTLEFKKSIKDIQGELKDIYQNLPKDDCYLRFIVSPDPRLDYTDNELHTLVDHVMTDLKKVKRNPYIKHLYAIHRDTDTPHIHFICHDKDLFVTNDHLDSLKNIALAHELSVSQTKEIDMAKYYKLNAFSYGSRAKRISHDQSFSIGFNALRFGKTTLDFEKDLFKKESNIIEKIDNAPIFEIRSKKREGAGRFGKVLEFRKPDGVELDDSLVKGALNRSVLDWKLRNDIHLESQVFDYNNYSKLSKKDPFSQYDKADFVIEFKTDRLNQHKSDFTALQIKSLKKTIKENLSKEAISQFHENNHTSLKRKRNLIFNMGVNSKGIKVFMARMGSTYLDGVIARKEAFKTFKASTKINFLGDVPHNLSKDYSISKGFFFYKNQKHLPAFEDSKIIGSQIKQVMKDNYFKLNSFKEHEGHYFLNVSKIILSKEAYFKNATKEGIDWKRKKEPAMKNKIKDFIKRVNNQDFNKEMRAVLRQTVQKAGIGDISQRINQLNRSEFARNFIEGGIQSIPVVSKLVFAGRTLDLLKPLMRKTELSSMSMADLFKERDPNTFEKLVKNYGPALEKEAQFTAEKAAVVGINLAIKASPPPVKVAAAVLSLVSDVATDRKQKQDPSINKLEL